MEQSETGSENNTDHSEVYQGLQIERQPAPTVRRTMAYVIDLGIVYAIIYLGMVLFVLLGIGLVGGGAALDALISQDGASPFKHVVLISLLVLVLLFLIGVYHGYFIYFEYKRGATPGKRIFGLSVVSLEGRRVTLGQCVLRDVLRYIDCMLVLPGLLSMGASRRKQRLGDLAAGTLVVYSSRKERRDEFVYISQDEYLYLIGVLKPQAVDKEMCSRFLAFAYPRFVRGKLQENVEQEQEWEGFAHHYLPEAKARGLDRQTTLLFFAEHCFQTFHTSN